MKRVALIGANGMLGRDLCRRLENLYTCIPADIEDLNVVVREDVLKWMDAARPEVLINVAAYTDVDGCETDRDWADRVNGEGAGNLAEGCARAGAMMLHMSTDFVFDGTKGSPYSEEDEPRPLSAYGASKLLGEQRIAEHLKRFLIIRTSWLFGRHGKNFVEAILNQAQVKTRLKVVNDQVGSPTHVPDLSEAIVRLMGSGVEGMIHVANRGACSWYDFAKRILELAGKGSVAVDPISSAELGRLAVRPANSALSCKRYLAVTGSEMRAWEDALGEYLDHRKA